MTRLMMIVPIELWFNRCPNTSSYHATQMELISALITWFNMNSITSSTAWRKTMQHTNYVWINPVKWMKLFHRRQYFRFNGKCIVKKHTKKIMSDERSIWVKCNELKRHWRNWWTAAVSASTRAHSKSKRRSIKKQGKELLSSAVQSKQQHSD